MKYNILVSGFLALSVGTEVLASESNHAVELGMSFQDSSGFNGYGTDIPRNSIEQKIGYDDFVPYIGYRYTNSNWRLRFGYQDFGSFSRNGVSPDSDVFGRGGLNLPVVTPFRVKEDINNINIDLTRLFPINDQWTFEAGPSINLIKQSVLITVTSNQVRFLKESKNSQQLGLLVGMNYAINNHADVSMIYRFNQVSDIKLHTLGINLGWIF